MRKLPRTYCHFRRILSSCSKELEENILGRETKQNKKQNNYYLLFLKRARIVTVSYSFLRAYLLHS